jgi:hypothetical protein
MARRGGKPKSDGKVARSAADFIWAKWTVERGWSEAEIAEKLVEVSAKAQERVKVKRDLRYPLPTTRNAAAAVDRERSRRLALKSSARP